MAGFPWHLLLCCLGLTLFTWLLLVFFRMCTSLPCLFWIGELPYIKKCRNIFWVSSQVWEFLCKSGKYCFVDPLSNAYKPN